MKVADFGLAKLVGTGEEPSAAGGEIAGTVVLTEAGKVMGTPQRLLSVGLVGASTACLILPGVVLEGVTILTLILVIDKRLDFWPAFKLSCAAVSRHWGKFFGALKMKRLSSYGWGLAAAVLTLIPLIPGFLTFHFAPAGAVSLSNVILPGICLAFGLWALIVLSQKGVRAAFASAKVSPVPTSPRLVWPWVMAAVVVLIPVLMAGGFLIMRMRGGSAGTQATSQTANSRMDSPDVDCITAPAGIRTETFGPVLDRVIATPNADDQGLVFFDLEMGQSFKPPFPLTFHPNQGPAFVELTPELKQWIKTRDVDVLLHLGEKIWDMMALEMQEGFVGQLKEWETILSDKVIGVFAKFPRGACRMDRRTLRVSPTRPRPEPPIMLQHHSRRSSRNSLSVKQ